MRFISICLLVGLLAVHWAGAAQAVNLSTLPLVTSGNSVIALSPADLNSQLFATTFSLPQTTSLPVPFAPLIVGTPVVGSATSPSPGQTAFVDIFSSADIGRGGGVAVHIEQRGPLGLGDLGQQSIGTGVNNYIEGLLMPTSVGVLNVRVDVHLDSMQDGVGVSSPYTWPLGVQATDFDFLIYVYNPSGLAVDPTKPLVRMTITRMATSSPVPEPSTYVLATMGVVALLAFKQRLSKNYRFPMRVITVWPLTTWRKVLPLVLSLLLTLAWIDVACGVLIPPLPTTLQIGVNGNQLDGYLPGNSGTPLVSATLSALDAPRLPPPAAPFFPSVPVVGSPSAPVPGQVAYFDIYAAQIGTRGSLGVRVEERGLLGLGTLLARDSNTYYDGIEVFSIPSDNGPIYIEVDVQLTVLQQGVSLIGFAQPSPGNFNIPTDFDYIIPIAAQPQFVLDPSQPLIRVTITRVRTNVVVPEPSTYALAATGVVAFLLVRRRKALV